MKKVRIKSAIPIYLAALVWLLAGLIRPAALLRIGTLIVVAAASALAYFAGSKLFPGREIEVRERADSGDRDLDRQIEQARGQLDQLAKYNDALPDPAISARLDRMVRAGHAILSELEKRPDKSAQVRRFLNYYLPASEKLMANYVSLDQAPAKGENIQSAMRSVEDNLEMIASAFERQLDSLYRDTTFDMEADISVLETILRSEGLAGGGFDRKQDEANGTGAPTA